MKRQGLTTTIEELRTIADELEAQLELNRIEGIPAPDGMKFLINIINKTPECSDTWRFEK